MQEAGLPKPSVIKPVFATIERGLILKKVGEPVHFVMFDAPLALMKMMSSRRMPIAHGYTAVSYEGDAGSPQRPSLTRPLVRMVSMSRSRARM